MSNINVELHTKSELNIGDVFTAEIKSVKNLIDELESKAVCVVNYQGRRARILGYVSNIPQYTNVLSDQLIDAMEANNIEKVDVEVIKKESQQVDDRFIYILSVNDFDIVTYLLAKNTNLTEVIEDIAEKIESENLQKDSQTSNRDTKLLIERAVSELNNQGDEANLNKEESFVLRPVRAKVSGLTKENPNKSAVTSLVKAGGHPELYLVEDKEGKLRIVFDGDFAGEVLLEDNNESIDFKEVDSIEVVDAKTLTYTIEMMVKDKQFNVLLEEEKPLNKEESLFVEIIKPILSSRDESDITDEEMKVLSDEVWNIVNRLNGKEVKPINQTNAEVACSSESVATNISNFPQKTNNLIEENNQPKELKAKKADTDEVKKIITYLATNGVPEKYINKIVKSHREYPVRYLERIPSSNDKGFTPWKHSGKGDNLLKDAISSIEWGKNLRFVGGKGGGKNTLLSTLAWVYQRPLFSQAASGDTDITHLYGDKTLDAVEINNQVAQKVEFDKGLLVEAMEIGGFYELGEGNACRSEVTMALHSVLDSRREIDVNGYKLVKAHDDFSFVLTMNVDLEGNKPLNQAFRDRFITIQFPSPYNIISLLKHARPKANKKDIDTCNKVYTHILSRVGELQTDDIVTIRGYINALDLGEDLGIKRALQMCVAYTVSDDELIIQEILEIIDSVVA